MFRRGRMQAMVNLKQRLDALMDRQQRCPAGLAGRAVGARMARQHAPETLWTISLLDVAPTDHVLEIGCGAGRAIEFIAARAPEGHVTGLDLSRAMVRAAGRHNGQAIEAGRVAIRLGDVARLPCVDRQFDKILSIHTLYFWPDPARAVAELARVLKPGGLLALTFSSGKVGAPEGAGVQAVVRDRVIPAMERSGFTTVRVERGPDSRRYKTLAVIGVMSQRL
jgi:ubiquinone/menaquinone biosynthesis C-methylase UbiE